MPLEDHARLQTLHEQNPASFIPIGTQDYVSERLESELNQQKKRCIITRVKVRITRLNRAIKYLIYLAPTPYAKYYLIGKTYWRRKDLKKKTNISQTQFINRLIAVYPDVADLKNQLPDYQYYDLVHYVLQYYFPILSTEKSR